MHPRHENAENGTGGMVSFRGEQFPVSWKRVVRRSAEEKRLMERFEGIDLYEPVLLEGISGGTHVCYLSDPIHLAHASKGLCDLVGYSQEEIEEVFHSRYSELIHIDDRGRFREFVFRLAKKEGSETIFYRLLSKDGRIVPVVDTMTSKILEDGAMWGFSVVNDLSGLSHETLASVTHDAGISLLEDRKRAPLHGMARISCGPEPRVLSVDDGMLLILGATQEELAHDRPATIKRLEAAYSDLISKIIRASSEPEVHSGLKRKVIRRSDGSYVRIANWTSWKGSPEEKVCQLFVVLDDGVVGVDEKIEEDLGNLERFSHEAADIVFSFNFSTGSLVCRKNSIGRFSSLPIGLPLLASEVLDIWTNAYLREEDKEKVRALIPLDVIPLEGVIKHEHFDILVGDDYLPASALLLSEGERGLLLIKFLDGVEGSSSALSGVSRGVQIRTFGSFDVFVDGEPVMFRNRKAKEYLALLVDRRGSFVTSKEALAALWPDSPVGERELSRTRKAAMNMNRTLERAGIADIVENDGSARRLVRPKVSCDLFDYIDDPEENSFKFRGSYMPEYSWAEETLAELTFSLYR